MVKVALLTRAQPAATFLVNVVQDVLPLDRVIYERWDRPPEAPPKGLVEKARAAGREAVSRARYYRERIEDQLRGFRDLEIDAQDKVFGHRWRAFEREPPISQMPDKDWRFAQRELEKDPPDLILVFGTSLIPSYVTEVAKTGAINIHTGLSPHYRGQNCTHFCIINEDFENIGVTVHLVRKAIDGGEIIVQRRPEIVTGDDEFTLNNKNQRVGAEIYAEIIERLLQGERFYPQTQPKDVGILLMNRALTPGHVSLVRTLIAEGAVDRYLKRAAKKKIRPKRIIEEIQMRNVDASTG